MAASFTVSGNRIVWSNADGDWSIWTAFVCSPTTGAVVGPGYVGRLKRPDGSLLMEDFYADGEPWRAGGLGSFGAHVARRNSFYPSQPTNFCWNLSERNGPGATPQTGVIAVRVTDGPRVDAQGVGWLKIETDIADPESYGDGSAPRPVFTIGRDYRIYDSRIECYTTTICSWDGTGSPLYVGEPKLFFAGVSPQGQPYSYRWLDVFDKTSTLLQHFDLWTLPAPTVHTHQIGASGRCRLRLGDGSASEPYFNVVAECARPVDAARFLWQGNPFGYDEWAQDANALGELDSTGAGYCLQGPGGTLTRQWEAWRWPDPSRPNGGIGYPNDPNRPQVTLALHAWEQGTGPYDCFDCYRQAVPGKSYQTWHCLSYDAGWVV